MDGWTPSLSGWFWSMALCWTPPRAPHHRSLSAIAWGELHALTPSKYLQNSHNDMGEWRHHIHQDFPLLHSQKHLVSARIFLLLLVLDKNSPSRVGIGDHA